MGNVVVRFGPAPKTFKELCARNPNPPEKAIPPYKRTSAQSKALIAADLPIAPKYYPSGLRAWGLLCRRRPKIDQAHVLSKLWEFRCEQAQERAGVPKTRAMIKERRLAYQGAIDVMMPGPLRSALEAERDAEVARLSLALPAHRKMPRAYEPRKSDVLSCGVPAELLVPILRAVGIAVRGRARSAKN